MVRDGQRKKGRCTPVPGLICNQSPSCEREYPGLEVWEEGLGPGPGRGRSLSAFAGIGPQAWPSASLMKPAVDLPALLDLKGALAKKASEC